MNLWDFMRNTASARLLANAGMVLPQSFRKTTQPQSMNNAK